MDLYLNVTAVDTIQSITRGVGLLSRPSGRYASLFSVFYVCRNIDVIVARRISLTLLLYRRTTRRHTMTPSSRSRSRSNSMSRTSVVVVMTLMTACVQRTLAYEVYGRVNEPLHIEDSQVHAHQHQCQLI